MVHHTCLDCQMGFVAVSQEEAEELVKVRVKEGKISEDEIEGSIYSSYATCCPYCGGRHVEAR